MMTEFGNRPPEFAVHRIGDMAQVNFYTDIGRLPDTENGERWQANELHLTVPWRQGLEQTVSDNYAAWLAMAQEAAGIEPPPTVEDRVGAVEGKTAALEETLDALFGGTV
jgi:hypothetical protein